MLGLVVERGWMMEVNDCLGWIPSWGSTSLLFIRERSCATIGLNEGVPGKPLSHRITYQVPQRSHRMLNAPGPTRMVGRLHEARQL